MEGWSEVRHWKGGDGRSIGTLGLSLSKGPSGKMEFSLGPTGSALGPQTPDVEKDVDLVGQAVPVGFWTLEKGNDKITLPRDSKGFVKTDGYREDTDEQVWVLLSSPGCSTLLASFSTAGASGGTIIQRKYNLCEVDRAAVLLGKK